MFYTIAVIVVYWITEAIPLAAMSLLLEYLLLETAVDYINDTNMLFVGRFKVAVAIEKWNLHKRLVLLVLINLARVVGSGSCYFV